MNIDRTASPRRRARRAGAAAALAVAIPAQAAIGQSAPPAEASRTVNVNYVYAAELGFGGYSVAGLSADVFTLPLGYTFTLDDAENGWKLRLRLPVQLGIYQFHATDVDGTPIKINQQSLGVVPGVELQVPVASNVVLKPFAELGYVHAFGTSAGADAVIYTLGTRTVAQWQAGAYTLSLGGGALYAGDTASDFSESYFAIQAGFEIRRPLGFTVGGIEPDLGVYAADYVYPKPLEFSRFLSTPLKISNQNEIGFTIGSARPLDTPLLGSVRIGVGYVFGGGLSVWHVAFGFPF